ncbi:MAG: type II secretion system F family protein [Dehalococcoidia bacterium]
MDLLALAASLCVMGAIIVGMLAFYQSSAGARSGLTRRLGTILGETPTFEVAMAQMEALRPKRLGRIPIISSILEGKSWTDETANRLERADMRFTVSEFVAIRVFVALILALLAFFLIGSGVGILVMVIAGFLGWLIPSIYVGMQIGKRVNRLNAQLPDTLTLLSNSIKAGFGLMQALDMASREVPHPLGTELKRTLADIHIGSGTEEALTNLAKRAGSADLEIVITAMLIQQSTGGNLSEILDNVAHTMRERIRIRGEIKTLTSQQLLTGFVIGGLPFAMIVLFSMLNPEYMKPLFTTTPGYVMIAGACVLEFFGVMVIRKILDIEV